MPGDEDQIESLKKRILELEESLAAIRNADQQFRCQAQVDVTKLETEVDKYKLMVKTRDIVRIFLIFFLNIVN